MPLPPVLNLQVMQEKETSLIKLELLDSGILVATYKRRKVITLDMAREIVQTRLDFAGREPRPVLVLNQGVLDMTREARHYVGTGDGIVGIKAAAAVRDQFSTFLIMSLIVRIEKPPFPHREFSRKQPALDWLSTFL